MDDGQKMLLAIDIVEIIIGFLLRTTTCMVVTDAIFRDVSCGLINNNRMRRTILISVGVFALGTS